MHCLASRGGNRALLANPSWRAALPHRARPTSSTSAPQRQCPLPSPTILRGRAAPSRGCSSISSLARVRSPPTLLRCPRQGTTRSAPSPAPPTRLPCSFFGPQCPGARTWIPRSNACLSLFLSCQRRSYDTSANQSRGNPLIASSALMQLFGGRSLPSLSALCDGTGAGGLAALLQAARPVPPRFYRHPAHPVNTVCTAPCERARRTNHFE
jgi:hypothetical protein